MGERVQGECFGPQIMHVMETDSEYIEGREGLIYLLAIQLFHMYYMYCCYVFYCLFCFLLSVIRYWSPFNAQHAVRTAMSRCRISLFSHYILFADVTSESELSGVTQIIKLGYHN